MKTATITQTVSLPASPKVVYTAWMSSKQHGSWTETEAHISTKVGGKFTVFDSWAEGKNVELQAGKRIVQTWRADDWPEDHFSTITVEFLPAAKGTKLVFHQSDVPASKAKSIAQGWKEYYWLPMKNYFSTKL